MFIEISKEDKEQIVKASLVVRKILTVILVVLICTLAGTWYAKQAITEVKSEDNVMTYDGTEQIPQFEVFAGEKQLSLGKDYQKKGEWMGEACGAYNTAFVGINNYRSVKSTKWTIQQGKASINKAEYSNGVTHLDLITSYVNGYVLAEILDSNDKVVHSKQVNGVQDMGSILKIDVNGELDKGIYTIKVTSVSFSEQNKIKVETKYGTSVTTKKLTVK